MSDRQREEVSMENSARPKGVPILILLFIIIFILPFGSQCFLEENLKLDDPYTWDFGQVKEGSILKHTFILKNESESPLLINKLQTSCGCTASVASNYEIPAGKTSKIQVTFNTKGYLGKVSQYAYVHTNDTKNPIIKLTIKAQILKSIKGGC